jgi:hypothetical protein
MTTKIHTEKQVNMAAYNNNNGFSKFCQETSLPGWSYLNSDISKVWKLLWIFFLCSAICHSAYVVYVNTQQYITVELG